MSETIQETLERYEKFVNERLKVDLKDTLDLRDQVYDKMSDYLKLRSQVETLKDNNVKEMKTMVDLGSNFYAQAKIPDTTYIYVNVGYGFHVQLTLSEALDFIEKKERNLQKVADQYTTEASKIKAHIKMVLEAIAEVLQIEQQEAQARTV
ncbi:Prefoldin alpha-like protein [Basidiobolus meristosporus CBS 931.73]|uniref:Prefoldin alpha-like protein n=1 Tax=Basidiobolus meristosporus CBS 931.73 TaxID=1314790 RepID=A0A1Y1Y1B8_9FUNG|nr:Prefoldin alpha-like protein [Basidiobolus meristosporus CBS 931.73]|eukprot:ORX91811.1 Prefoldin alpha-like protein [Basidiobolus meristosporus CBS 931.73]